MGDVTPSDIMCAAATGPESGTSLKTVTDNVLRITHENNKDLFYLINPLL
jgi:hypothetical protein